MTLTLLKSLKIVADLARQGVLESPGMAEESARQDALVSRFEGFVEAHGLDLDLCYGAEINAALGLGALERFDVIPEIDLDDFRLKTAIGVNFEAMRLVVLELACQQYGFTENDEGFGSDADADLAIDAVAQLLLVREADLQEIFGLGDNPPEAPGP